MKSECSSHDHDRDLERVRFANKALDYLLETKKKLADLIWSGVR